MESCHPCAKEAEFHSLPPHERIAADDRWRVVHAFDSALPGWLVLLPRRHVTALHDLTDAEAAGLGTWQVRLSRALQAVTGCAKTYVVQFAEAEGFAHVHFHIVPRMADLPMELRGPNVFHFLRRPDEEHMAPERMEALSLALRDHLLRPSGH
ncbi:HIT family protein [Streptomyces sp. NPDC058751]|uniref:HIT family protein n=1 Tax=Streptomyces sp. NPDC058751 TaxID=3346623 RepID=UPI00368BD342